MKRFDCLSVDCQLFGPHLLEASAGTGKTFTIEHVFVRLILEKVPLEQILVVTFTRAATRELKHRIRANIEKAMDCLTNQNAAWPYLLPFMGSEEAKKDLSQAILCFDDAKIFTIHGFCYRMLKEFAFEAGKLIPMNDPDDELEIARKIRSTLAEFWLAKVDKDLLCPEQIALLFGKYDTLQELGLAIASAKKEEETRSFTSWHSTFVEALKKAPSGSPSDEFFAVFSNYKAHQGDFDTQIEWLTAAIKSIDDPVPFRKLIFHQASLFEFLDPSNRKIRAKNIPSPFLDWAVQNLGPIILEASDRKNVFKVLKHAWKKWEKEKIGILQPDEIVEQMRQALEIPAFLQPLQKRFQAVIIDEFQDTDPLQWDIFQKAFLQCPTLFLVGDPKQSIYRFRSADVYTYFLAKQTLGIENIYQLDTNFRSSKEMIGSLNALFSRNWLPLPQKGGNIDYDPVNAGSIVSSCLKDEKKAIHWMLGDETASFEKTFLPFTVNEIEKLQISEYKSVAILVKDRYELQSTLDLLRVRGIPCMARSQQLLCETFDFCALRELLEAIANPDCESARLIAQLGPYQTNFSYAYWKAFIEENGLPKFFSEFFKTTTPDLMQTIEALLAWEEFTFEGLPRFFYELETVKKRADCVEDAVQILTLHVSKGLEFDIVFALALASPSVEQDEEINAEKLRQLYVAMTRAKKRLYVPYKPAKSKRVSPMDLFVSKIESEVGSFIPYLGKLSENHDLSFEPISTPFVLPYKKVCYPEQEESVPLPVIRYGSSYIQSFTSLAQSVPLKIESEDDPLPRGKEVGTVIHEVLETIFRTGMWKSNIDPIVEKILRTSSLAPLTSHIQNLIQRTLSQELSDGKSSFCIRDVSDVFPEMEFLYKKEANFITGSIDLALIYDDKVYFIDWKTNVLSKTKAEAVMKANDYSLQALLYKEALQRHFSELVFGGAFYIFVRTGEYVFIE